MNGRAVTRARPRDCALTHDVSSSALSNHRRETDSGERFGRSALREASLTGVRWSSLTRLVAEAFSFGGSIVLAHLIAPAEFGRTAVALGIALIAPAVTGASFGVPLVQMRTLDRAHIEAAMVLSIATGAGLMLATIFIISPLAIEPAFGSRVAYLLALVSPVFALAGVGTVPTALLQRELRFRRLSQIEILSIVTAPVTSISLAATTNLGAEAIVLGGVAAAVVGTLLTVVSAPRVGFGWRRAYARDVAGVGAFAALTSVVESLSSSVHYAILGARLPAHDVGLFWRAYQLAVGYQVKVGVITMRLAFPLFSRSGNLDEMRHLRSRILQVQCILIFPLLATLVVLAPEIVPLLFGRRWEDAAVPTQILAVAGMATIAASAGNPLAFAAGKQRPLFYFNLIQLAGFAAVVLWTSSYGFREVAIAIAAYQVVLVAAQFVYLESREVGIPLRETWEALVPASVASGAALVVAYPTVRLLSPEVGDVALVLAGGAFSIGIYTLVLRVGFPSSWSAIVRILVALARPGAGRASAEIPAAQRDRPAEAPNTAHR
jgi:O-antigen/teichoic acid export membrane protein